MTDPNPNPEYAFPGWVSMIVGFFLDLLKIAIKIAILLVLLVVGLLVIVVPLVFLSPAVMIILLIAIPFGGLYRHSLARRYLIRKISPLFAGVAVALCTMMVIVVLSIMGGFLDMLKDAGRAHMGDVMLTAGGRGGFAHYEQIIAELEKLPEIERAIPIIQSPGLLQMTFDAAFDGKGFKDTRFVLAIGVNTRDLAEVTAFKDTIYWTQERLAEMKKYRERSLEDWKKSKKPYENKPMDEISKDVIRDLNKKLRIYQGLDTTLRVIDNRDLVNAALDLKSPWSGSRNDLAGIILGIEVNRFNNRNDEGGYFFVPHSIVGWKVSLTVPTTTASGTTFDSNDEDFVVVNETHSGYADVDEKFAFIPFERLQNMMNMQSGSEVVTGPDGAPIINDDGEVELTGWHKPARCSEIHIRAASGISSVELKKVITKRFETENGILDQIRADALRNKVRFDSSLFGMQYITWQDKNQGMINAVTNEKRLLAFLFGFISTVAIVLIAVLFYMIVMEKTRDIGILRAIGASRAGVASIFLGFASAVGTVGAALGATMGCLIVHYINEIHDWLGSTFGLVIWSKKTYFFDSIPNNINPFEVTIIIIIAIGSSLVGALIPAWKASRVNPIESLRYE